MSESGYVEGFKIGRAEGRREILREIAASRDPRELRVCTLCDTAGYFDIDASEQRLDHKPTCLWLRAQQETKR